VAITGDTQLVFNVFPSRPPN